MWPRMPEVWVPLGLDPNVGRRDARMLRVIGRIRSGATVEQARAELDGPRRRSRSNIRTPTQCNRRDRCRPARAADARRQAIALRLDRRGAGAAAGRVRERRWPAHRRCARAAPRVRHASRARRQPFAHRPDRSWRRNAVIGLLAAGRGIRAGGLGKRLSRRRRPLCPACRGRRRFSIGATSFVVGVLLSLVCTTACALFASL